MFTDGLAGIGTLQSTRNWRGLEFLVHATNSQTFTAKKLDSVHSGRRRVALQQTPVETAACANICTIGNNLPRRTHKNDKLVWKCHGTVNY